MQLAPTAAPAALVTFEIRTAYFDTFRREFAKLARKAIKLGLSAPSFVVVQSNKVIPAVVDTQIAVADTDDYRPNTATPRIVRGARVVHVITVSGDRPIVNGWTFVAALQHEAGRNLVRTVPGVEIQIARDLRSAKPSCEHCGLDRRRADTYVVAHDDGRQIQVGRTCLKDFTGHESPESIARWAELLGSFVEACASDGESFGGSYGEPIATLDEYLPFVCANIRALGWLSRTAARDTSRSSTADGAWICLFPPPRFDRSKLILPTDVDVARAAKVLEVARAHFDAHATDDLPDYEHNVRIVVESISVTSRTAGIAASIVQFAERLMGREIERRRAAAQAAASVYVGTVGKREVMTLTIERVINVESQFGTSFLHIMADAAGNALKWFSSSARLEAGTTYTGKCTVKSHEEYKGTKQTMLSRCALKPVVLEVK